MPTDHRIGVNLETRPWRVNADDNHVYANLSHADGRQSGEYGNSGAVSPRQMAMKGQ
jgi:hypothetical protein